MSFLPSQDALGSYEMQAPNRLAIAGASDGDIGSIVSAAQPRNQGIFDTLAGDIGLGVIDLADTVTSSIPVLSKAFGLERGDVNAKFLQAIDSPGLQNFYNQNRGGIEAASGIMGVIAAELTARKLTAPTGALITTLKTVPWARRIATLDDSYSKAMQAVRVADKALASRGAIGAESFVGRVLAPAEGLTVEASRKSLVSTAKWLGTAKGVRNAAVSESIMATTLNQNGFLYTDDYAHNALWMGLGLGIGGAFERVVAGYSIRKAVNSDEIRRAYIEALDPDDIEGAKVGWFGKKDSIEKGRAFQLPSEYGDGQGLFGGHITDNVTNLLTAAKSRTGTPTDNLALGGQSLKSNRSSLATQDLELAREEIQKVTTKGIEGDGFTRFGNKTRNSSGVMNHLDQIMKHDPTGMYGLEEIGASYGPSALLIHQKRESRVAGILDDVRVKLDEYAENPPSTKAELKDFKRLQAMSRRYGAIQKRIPVPFIDGERATLSDLQALDGWVEPTIVKSVTPDKNNIWEAVTENSGRRVALESNGTIHTPDNIPVKDLDHYDVLRLYRLGKQMLDTGKQQPLTITLPKDASHFQLDLAEELLTANPATKVFFPEGMTRESAKVESFAQKAEVLRLEGRKAKMKEIQSRKKGIDYDPEVEASKLRVRLNLPKMTAYERGVLGESAHPLEKLLRGAADYGPDKIREMALTDLMMGASEMKRIGDFAPSAASDFKKLSGNSFNYMIDDLGQPTAPILAYSRPLNPHEWADDALAERMAAARLNLTGKLAEGKTLTSNLQRAILSSSDTAAASETRGLIETQVQGTTFGTNHLEAPGAVMKALKNRDWIARDNPVLLAATRLQQMVQNITRDFFQREAKGLQRIAGQLDSPRNAASKMLLNSFVAHRPGWDFAIEKGEIVTIRDMIGAQGDKAVTKFVLEDTPKNQARWQELFGERMPEEAVLTSPNGREVVLDEMGMGFMNEFQRMTDSILENKNQLLRAQNLRGIDKIPMYIPPKNLNGKYIGFTTDIEGNVVPGMTVIAATESEFTAQRTNIMKMIEEKGLDGYQFRSRDQIKQFADIWDRAQMDMIDPGTTAIQGGKSSKGLLQSPDIDMKGVEGILDSLRTQYMNHGQDVLTTNMKDQLQSAESRANVATGVSRNNANPAADQKYRSIHEMYMENLTGASPLRSRGSVVGGLYNWAEGKGDQIIASLYPGIAGKMGAVNSFLGRARFWDKSEGSRKDFESLTEYLGEYMPFKSAAEYVERLGAGTMPPQMKDFMSSANRFTASIMLRWFEPAMAVMNLGGMVNAMPAVIRHVQQQVGETAAEHAQRVGHLADIFEGAGRNGESIGVLNMGKLMTKGFERAWKKTSHPDFNYMQRMGYLTQEVAEFHKQFGAIETKSDWQRVLMGSADAKNLRANPKNIADRMTTEKGVDGWISVLTDKSEDFSRSWGHMVGLELAENLGIKKMEAKHSFAHDLANKMIANYNPNNRPEVFQGAMGAPIGLFQSFIMNYYQRMFRYIETKDMRSLATQAAMQASLFGVPTIPGFSEASKLFFAASGGEVDTVQAIQEKFGQQAGDVLFGGVLSNIPKLFGAEGVDLYSRGDTAVRLPGLQPPPAMAVATKAIGGTIEALKLFGSKNPQLSTTQLAEVLSNTIPNRPTAGVVEQLFAGGNDTDGAGQIVSDTTSAMESVYRMMGVRSMRQSKELEAFYSSKNQQALQNSQMDVLKKATRTAFREGDMDRIPLILEQYLEQGGSPRNARRWLMAQHEAATSTRGQRMLESALKSEDKMDYAVRLLDAGVSIDDDEATQPYSESLEVDASEFGGVNNQMMDYDSDSVISDPTIGQ